jgi:predicted DNA repair protein MutK
LWVRALILVVVALVITVAVYGAVGLIVKMDDVGLHLTTADGDLQQLIELQRLVVSARELQAGLERLMPDTSLHCGNAVFQRLDVPLQAGAESLCCCHRCAMAREFAQLHLLSSCKSR